MKSVKNLALSSLLILAQAFCVNSCFANEFPGTGSKEAWQQAWQLSNQGNALLQAGQHAQGFELLHKAIEIYPGDAELLYSLAGAHQAYAHMTISEAAKVAELEKAEVYLKQAVKIKPSQAEVLIRMANIQSELKKDSESIANLKTVLAMTTLDPSVRQKTEQALQYVEAKSAKTATTSSTNTSTNTSKNTSKNSSANSLMTQSTTSSNDLNWQTYTAPSSLFSLQYPSGWSVSTDPKSGKIEAKNSSGANLAILPFYTSEKLGNTTGFFTALLKSLAPQEQWSKPETVSTAMRSSYISSKEKAVAVLEIFPITNGTGGKICIAKSPIGTSAIPFDVFGKILTSLRFNTEAIATASKPSTTSSNNSAPNTVAQNTGESASSGNANNSQSNAGSSNTGSSPANPIFGSYQIFNDPKENAFSVEVPSGWNIEGGLYRAGQIDTRPWVVAVAPDKSCRVFIGDGEIPSYTIPSSTLNWTGFTQGKAYNGTLVHDYIPARKFVELYARKKLNTVLTNIQVVEEHDHPEIASAYNSSNATRSEANSIKVTGMFGNVPAVAYFLASTKANVSNGTGMWWVTLIAGVIGRADNEKQGLDVIRHMLGTFNIKREWQSASNANTAAVSRNYQAQARIRDQQIQTNYANIQAANNRITSGYWAQQAANDRISAGYWNRQASQDRTANNFSNYIRGQETVRDTSTGTNYQVEYGPKYHWIDGGGNHAATNYGSPGAGWNQLLSVP